jgi:hypothetical protein
VSGTLIVVAPAAIAVPKTCARNAQLVLEVDIRGRDEGVNPGGLGALDCHCRPLDVALIAAGKSGNGDTLHPVGYGPHRLEVAR